MTRPRLLWEGDPLHSKLWASVPGVGSTEAHIIPEEDTIEHVRSWRCACRPEPEYVGPGWVWTHRAQDGREDS